MSGLVPETPRVPVEQAGDFLGVFLPGTGKKKVAGKKCTRLRGVLARFIGLLMDFQ
jgi:hypothetical protein